MPTQQQYQNTILSARYQMMTLVIGNQAQMHVGNNEVKWAKVRRFKRNIKAAMFVYAQGDYVSTNAVSLFNCLNVLIGINTVANVVDPHFQNPSFNINNNPPFAPLILTKSQADVIDAGGGNWYLPFLDSTGNPIVNGSVPVSVTSNGISFTFTYDDTTFPARIYGFGSNSAQTIIVTII